MTTQTGVMQDIRFAARSLRKSPGFSFTGVSVLALGIAASVTIWSFVDAALLQPLPYDNPSRLVSVSGGPSSCDECVLSYLDYRDLKKNNTVFSSFDVWEPSVYLWKSSSGTQAVRNARVSGGFFHTLGVRPMLGRGLAESDDAPNAPLTVVLTHGAWKNRFGGRPDIIGQTLILDEQQYTVVGVMPREFHFALRAAEFFAPIHDTSSCENTRSCRNLLGIARLKEGVSLETARANLRAIAASLEEEYPDSNKGQSASIKLLRDSIVGDIRPTILLLGSGVGLLLLIACVNVLGLLLVRAENRKREIAVRRALGASWAQLLRGFFAEGALLSIVGVAAGLAIANVMIPRLFLLIPERGFEACPISGKSVCMQTPGCLRSRYLWLRSLCSP